MRICMILSTNYPPEEGIGYYVHNLSKMLEKRGHEMTIVTRGNLRHEEMIVDGLRVIKLPFLMTYPFHVGVHGMFVSSYIKRHADDFDLIHVHSPLSPVPPKIDVPIISTIHTSVIEDTKHAEVTNLRLPLIRFQTDYISRPLIQKLIDLSDAVTTVSHAVANELMQYYGKREISVVGNAVDENIFYPSCVNNSDRYVLYTGRLSYRKGILDLLDVAPSILRGRDIKIIICGKGELEAEIRRKIASQNLGEKIQLLGHVDRKRLIELYQNATVYCLPSLYEGLPTVALEAMASGAPVVARNIPALNQLISNGENGLVVDDIATIADEIGRLLDDEVLRCNIIRQARETVLRDYTWSHVCDRVEAVYETVC